MSPPSECTLIQGLENVLSSIDKTGEERWHFVLVVRGRLSCGIEGGRRLVEGPVLLRIKPGATGKLYPLAGETPRSMDISSLSPGNRDIREILLRTGARSILGPESPSVLLFPLNPIDEQRIENIFYSITQETELAGRGSAELILLRLSELALLLERHEATEHPVPDVRAGACRPEDIDTWLRKHFTEALNLDQIAHALGYSPAWLSRLYRARKGTCLFEEVNRLRIERACYLLKYSEKSVTDIAFEVGYNNVSFFNRMFRRHLAVNPAAFRVRSK